jgi:DNA-binding transcriptional MerR regulator
MSIAFSSGVPDAAQDEKTTDEVTIGEMARDFDVSLRTLRFYEHRGLLSPRRAGASRFYGPADRKRLQTVLKGKQLGFTLTEIRDLLAGPNSVGEMDIEETLGAQQILGQVHHLERQRDEIDAAIARLRATYQRRAGDHASQ